ncbi:MAG: sugar ABC transporter permease [Clostridiales bacterium]|nr:sugar ABC transporter permease [Clostridiales bacterium]
MKRKTSKNARKMIQAIPFMLPSFIGMIIFSLLPIITAIGLSFTDWSGLGEFSLSTITNNFIGLKNYKQLLGNAEFWMSVGHVLYFIALYIPLAFISAMLVALILNSSKKVSGVLRVLYYIPVLTSWVAASLIWRWVLSSQYGVLNSILSVFGITGPDWLTNKYWAMPGIVLASVWKDMGYYGLYIFGGLRGIDPTYYEAARVDGANKRTILFKITIPLLSPTLFYCLIMSLINAFQLFPQVQIMTGGGPNGATQVPVERIYTYAFSYFKMGYASAYSWLLFVIILILTLIQLKAQKAWVHYEA